ncbi:MAG: transglutaminase domain-containing protein [Cellulosilyticaceae bacterium]
MMQICKHKMIIGLIGIWWMLFPILTYGNSFISQKGVVGNKYEVNYQGTRAVLSRDGAEAVPVANHTVITKPGTYYLNVWNQNNIQEMSCFTIAPGRGKSTYVIKKQEDLEEAFKEILENYKTEVWIQLEYGKMTPDQLNQLFSDSIQSVLVKYPMITYEGYRMYTAGGYKPQVQMTLSYPASTQTLKQYEALAKQSMYQMIENTLTPDLTDYEKEWKLYDRLVNRTTYSKDVVNGVAPPLTHTVQGTVVKQVGVCDGYAKTMMYLLNAVGVPTKFVVGEARDASGYIQGHAWNLVKIQGQYYHVDATWGDIDTEQIGTFYGYFNETDQYMAKTHTWEAAKYPKAVATQYSMVYMPMPLPGVYHADSQKTWNQTLVQIKQEGLREGTIILSGTQLMSQNTNRLLDDLVGILKRPIGYREENKYQAKIITYRITN